MKRRRWLLGLVLGCACARDNPAFDPSTAAANDDDGDGDGDGVATRVADDKSDVEDGDGDGATMTSGASVTTGIDTKTTGPDGTETTQGHQDDAVTTTVDTDTPGDAIAIVYLGGGGNGLLAADPETFCVEQANQSGLCGNARTIVPMLRYAGTLLDSVLQGSEDPTIAVISPGKTEVAGSITQLVTEGPTIPLGQAELLLDAGVSARYWTGGFDAAAVNCNAWMTSTELPGGTVGHAGQAGQAGIASDPPAGCNELHEFLCLCW